MCIIGQKSFLNAARHRSQDFCPPISQIVQKNFIKIRLIIEECAEEILIKLEQKPRHNVRTSTLTTRRSLT
jgi:hypothetical protein